MKPSKRPRTISNGHQLKMTSSKLSAETETSLPSPADNWGCNPGYESDSSSVSDDDDGIIDLGRGKRLNFDEEEQSDEAGQHQPEACKPQTKTSGKISHTSNDYNLKLYNLLWPMLKHRGWTSKAGGGVLSAWTYFAPGVRKSGDGVENETKFSTEQALLKFVETSDSKLFRSASDELAQDEKIAQNKSKINKAKKKTTNNPVVSWSEAWNTLQAQGWTVKRGKALEDWHYLAPGSSGLKRNVDYFVSKEDVLRHVKEGEPPKLLKKPRVNGEEEVKIDVHSLVGAELGNRLEAEGCTSARHLALLATKTELELKQLLPGTNTGQALVLKETLMELFGGC